MTNYNNSQFTIDAIESLALSDLVNYRVIIVDNDSKLEQIDMLKNIKNEKVSIIYSNENTGYFPGLNIGIESIKDELVGDFLVYIGNNDVIYPKNIAKECLNGYGKLKGYPVISPDIRTLDNTPQNPHVISRISKFRGYIYDFYHASYLGAVLVSKLASLSARWTKRADEDNYKNAQEIYQGYGAMYILTPSFFQHFQYLPEESKLMYEEYFLSLYLYRKGFKVYYSPLFSLIHCCKGATGALSSKVKWNYSRVAHKKYSRFLKEFKGY